MGDNWIFDILLRIFHKILCKFKLLWAGWILNLWLKVRYFWAMCICTTLLRGVLSWYDHFWVFLTHPRTTHVCQPWEIIMNTRFLLHSSSLQQKRFPIPVALTTAICLQLGDNNIFMMSSSFFLIYMQILCPRFSLF